TTYPTLPSRQTPYTRQNSALTDGKSPQRMGSRRNGWEVAATDGKSPQRMGSRLNGWEVAATDGKSSLARPPTVGAYWDQYGLAGRGEGGDVGVSANAAICRSRVGSLPGWRALPGPP